MKTLNLEESKQYLKIVRKGIMDDMFNWAYALGQKHKVEFILNEEMRTEKHYSYKEKLKVGDIVERWVAAPWDENVPIRITGKIVKVDKRLFFEGTESNNWDDFI